MFHLFLSSSVSALGPEYFQMFKGMKKVQELNAMDKGLFYVKEGIERYAYYLEGFHQLWTGEHPH
ncbi:hypothetical protein B0G93_105171 [Bacillus sp. V-88]|nr:hypothetical protein B0G93_105171 [Bacillus sp. V-88]SLK20316.1 hypothetical protein SAMN06295884_105171 [Bacillus sp. V-88]